MFIQASVLHKSFLPGCSLRSNLSLSPHFRKPVPLCFSISAKSDSKPSSNSDSAKPKTRTRRVKTEVPGKEDENGGVILPKILPKKPRRGRKSEAAAVEDFVRDSLEQTFASIRKQNSEVFEDKENVLKDRVEDSVESDNNDENDDDKVSGSGKKTVVEEDSENWPIDADEGWGIRASQYFEEHSIRNVTGEDGVVIDWEGEVDNGWVKEINCLEWESFAFHPSPLIVVVFERYNRATDNWKVLKELEKAGKVYWTAKDRLPPRMVKVDINIEKDLAYALKVKEGPQVLFLRGNKILYREKEARTSDELVHMIAHFYYNAKKPLWVDAAAVSRY